MPLSLVDETLQAGNEITSFVDNTTRVLGNCLRRGFNGLVKETIGITYFDKKLAPLGLTLFFGGGFYALITHNDLAEQVAAAGRCL